MLEPLACNYSLQSVTTETMATPCLDLVSPADYWHSLHQQQSDWALRAYARLVTTLSTDVQEKLRSTAGAVQPYVVIFGKTQVGKTTLLLDLMGVTPTQMAAISQVLRGGRETGKSATATAMEYRRSTSEHWGLDMPGSAHIQWLDSDADISAALGQLRTTMERGKLPADAQPCVVHIPQRFFAGTPSAAPQVRILDLPGDNPANPAEQQHVERVAQTYLPFADLILLVGRGDDLGFLQPGVITLPGIEDWQAMPRRFRVVTTYSYYAKNIKDQLRTGQLSDVVELRKRLIKQIQTFSPLSPAAQDAALYFPLEFGTSWQELAQTEPDLYANLTPLIAQLRTELLQDIANATTPMGRLRSTWDTHHSVKYLREKKISIIENQIKVQNKTSETISTDISNFKKLIERSENYLKNLKTELDDNTLEDGKCIISNACLDLPIDYPPKANSEENCESLRAMLREYRRMLLSSSITPANTRKKSSAYWRKVRHEFQEPDREDIEKIINDELCSIHSKLDGYWFDKYFKTANYEADKNNAIHAANTAKQKLTELWRIAWILALQEVDKQLRKYKSDAQSQVAIYNNEKEILCKQLAAAKAHIDKLHSEKLCIENITKEDLQRCDQFDIFLNEEYATTLHQKMEAIFTTDDDCSSLLQLLSCAELKNQREEFMQRHPTAYQI